MSPPAAAVIGGTLGGLWFSEQAVADCILPTFFFLTVLVVFVFFAGLWILRKKPGRQHLYISSQTQLRYRYGFRLYWLGLLALFCVAAWNGICRNGALRSDLPVGEQVFMCLKVIDFPVNVITEKGRLYHRMDCRLLMYSLDGVKQLPGNENVVVYVAADTSAGDTNREYTSRMPGDILISRCRSYPIDNFQNSAVDPSFDYKKYMLRRGFFCRAYVYRYQFVEERLTLVERFRRLRVPLTSRWEGKAGALLSGICLGDKSGIGRDVRERFTTVGVAHILAVSGLHVGVLYGSLVLLLGLPFRIAKSLYFRKKTCVDCSMDPIDVRARQLLLQKTYSLSQRGWVHVFALLLIWSYAAVVGFSASVVRAALMLSIYGIGKVMGYKTFGLNVLSMTAIILVVLKPYNLYDPGFQLSFFAVLGLMLFFPLLRNLLSVRNVILKYVWELFCCSLAVQLGTLWLVSGMFGMIPLYGLLCNFVVVPFGSVILYVFLVYLIVLGVVAVAGTPVVAALNHITHLLHYLAGVLERVVIFFAQLPGSSIRFRPDLIEQLLILWCTAYLYCIWSRRNV